MQLAGRAIGNALIAKPDFIDLALILRHRLSVPSRLWLAAGAVMALPEVQAAALSEAVLADIERHRIGDLEAERQRQLRRWDAHCADPARRTRGTRPWR